MTGSDHAAALRQIAEECVALVAQEFGRRLDWTEHGAASGTYAVSVQGLTALPFTTANRVLCGDPYESLGSFLRAFPAILDRGRGTTTD